MNENRNNGQFRKILVGYDGSRSAEEALEVGFAIASTMDSQVEVLAVTQPPEPPAALRKRATAGDAREHYERALGEITRAAQECGIQLETVIAVGHPAEQIIQRAEQGHADLIIVGERGSSNIERAAMGSVAERVLRYAPCPVLLTR